MLHNNNMKLIVNNKIENKKEARRFWRTDFEEKVYLVEPDKLFYVYQKIGFKTQNLNARNFTENLKKNNLLYPEFLEQVSRFAY